MNIIKISGVICTHNCSELLPKAIESLIDQTLDKSLYDIVVVDNGSTDETRQVCDGFREYSNLRYVYEPELGLSNARNTGIANAKGEIVAFIDDDATADSNWLLNIEQMFSNSSFYAIGGKVLPVFEKPRPTWLYPGIDRILTILDLGNQIVPFEYPYNGPCGTNMAFRKSVFEKIGYFDPALGRIGKNLLGAEETDLFKKMELNSMNFVYAPDCTVYHLVPEKRLTRSYVRKRYYYQGYSVAFLALKYDSFVNVLFRDILSLFHKMGSHNDSQKISDKSAKKGLFYYEVKGILYCTYLFFLVINAFKKILKD